MIGRTIQGLEITGETKNDKIGAKTIGTGETTEDRTEERTGETTGEMTGEMTGVVGLTTIAIVIDQSLCISTVVCVFPINSLIE